MKWLDRLDRKIGRFAIPHVMYLLSGIMLAVYLAGFLFPDWNLEALLYLDRELVAQGEAWRLITLDVYKRQLLGSITFTKHKIHSKIFSFPWNFFFSFCQFIPKLMNVFS